MKVMQQMVFEDSLRVEQLRFEIAVKSNQINHSGIGAVAKVTANAKRSNQKKVT